jgi:hypothetical protein
MPSRNLSRRLGRLEARLAPLREPISFVIDFVAPGGEVRSTLVLGPNGTRTWKKGTEICSLNSVHSWRSNRP